LKEGMHAIKMATATSTQDQFIASTKTPIGAEVSVRPEKEMERKEIVVTHRCGPQRRGSYK
jgi:hypothetical protein